MAESLLDQAHRQVDSNAERCHAMLSVAAPAIASLQQLSIHLAGRGWKPTPKVTVDARTGVQLSINVSLLARRPETLGELLDEINALDITVFRGNPTEHGDSECLEYTLHLAGSLRITLLVIVRSRRVLAAA